MKKKFWITGAVILSVCLAVTVVNQYGKNRNTKNFYYISEDCEGKLENLSLIPDTAFSSYDSLMIVAHPDDESIWGGAHLREGNYVVVCITNGNNRIRRKEFEKVMKETNSVGIIMTYPDKTMGKRDNWDSCREQIQEDLNYILSQKQWEQIVTHNPDGEYGHIHHKMTSAITTAAAQEQNCTDKLYYFGKYVKKKNMDKAEYAPYLSESLSDRQLENKLALNRLYKSQKRVVNGLAHMFPYENWVKADAWSP